MSFHAFLFWLFQLLALKATIIYVYFFAYNVFCQQTKPDTGSRHPYFGEDESWRQWYILRWVPSIILFHPLNRLLGRISKTHLNKPQIINALLRPVWRHFKSQRTLRYFTTGRGLECYVCAATPTPSGQLNFRDINFHAHVRLSKIGLRSVGGDRWAIVLITIPQIRMLAAKKEARQKEIRYSSQCEKANT